jgi:hypothetical protein
MSVNEAFASSIVFELLNGNNRSALYVRRITQYIEDSDFCSRDDVVDSAINDYGISQEETDNTMTVDLLDRMLALEDYAQFS